MDYARRIEKLFCGEGYVRVYHPAIGKEERDAQDMVLLGASYFGCNLNRGQIYVGMDVKGVRYVTFHISVLSMSRGEIMKHLESSMIEACIYYGLLCSEVEVEWLDGPCRVLNVKHVYFE